MSPVYMIPIVLGVLIGLLVALLTWGLWHSQNQRTGSLIVGARGDVLMGLLILAAFTLGIFVAYLLMGFV